MKELGLNKITSICKDYVKRLVEQDLDPTVPDWMKEETKDILDRLRSGDWSDVESVIDNEWSEDYYIGDETKRYLDYFCASGSFDQWFKLYKNKELKKRGSK